MTSPLGQYGSKGYEGPESRTLGKFASDKFSYREQAKNIIELNNAVGYMSGYMRKMQRGIDEANQNFVQQIQGLLNDFLVIVGGGGDTAFEFGDFKYVLQALGALFGFANEEGEITLPINLFQAAWYFFSSYILPVQNFTDAINMIVDSLIAGVLDIFGEFPVVGQALEQLAVIISDLRDILIPVAQSLEQLLNSFFGVELGDLPGIALFGDTFKPILDSFEQALSGIPLPDFSAVFHEIAMWTVPFVESIAAAIDALTYIVNLVLGTEDLARLPEVLLNILSPLDSALLQGFISDTLIPLLDASKIGSGTFNAARLQPLIDSISTAFGGGTGLNFSGLNSILLNIPGAQPLIDALANGLGHPGTGYTPTDILSFIGLIPGGNIASTLSASVIPNIDASKIVSGVLNALQIPGLDGNKIVSGKVAQTFLDIVSVAANLITGVLATGQIPGLDASKITGGTFADAFVPGLGNRLLTTVFRQSARGGSNFVIGPDFTDSTIARTLYGTPTSSGYSTEQFRSSPYSFKWVQPAAAQTGIYFDLTGQGDTYIATKAGDKFYLEVWTYSHASNNHTVGALQLGVRFVDSSGVNANAFDSISRNLTTITVGQWVKHSLYTTVPTGYDRMYAWIVGLSTVPAGNAYYADDLVWREVTEAQNVIQQLFGGTTVLGSILPASVPGLDGSKITGGTIAQSFLGITNIAAGIVTGTFANTQIPKTLDNTWIPSAVWPIAQIPTVDSKITAIDASKVTTGQMAQARVNITDIAASIVSGVFGNAQIPKTLDNTWIPSAVWPIAQIPTVDSKITTVDGSKITTGQIAQARLNITSIATSILTGTIDAVTQLSGTVPIAQIPTVDSKITTVDGSKITTGQIATPRITDLVSVIQQLYNGTNILSTIGKANVPKTLDNTWMPGAFEWPITQIPTVDSKISVVDGSKITSGNIADARVPGLANRALQTVLNSKALAGANLVVDPGFDNPDVWAYEKGVMDTAQHLTGTTSRRMTADGTLQSIYLTASGGPGLGQPWMVRPGAVYYFEASVYPHAANVGGGQIGVIGAAWDSTNVNPFQYILQPYLGPPPAKGQWTTYSGYLTMPVGYDGFIPWCTVVNDVPVGDQFYWDRIVVKEATRVGNSPDLGAIADHILNGLIGGPGYTGAGTGVPPDQSRGGLDHIYAEVISHTSALQKLESDEQGIDNSGISINLDFSDYPDGNLPSIFAVTYSGAGTSTLGITNGQGGWRNKVNDGNRNARGAYNHPTQQSFTNSDYQVIRGTLGALPEGAGSGGAPKIGVMGRLNSPTNPITFVWGRGYCSGFLAYKGEMGCTVNNVETVWVSNVSLDWSTDIRCVFGVGTQPRRYQFFSGSKLVYDQVEVGTASGLGAGFRYFGLTAEIRTVASGTPKIPGTLAAASISDNAPPTTVGSGAQMYRTSASLVNISPGVNIYPANFFGIKRYESADITASLADGSFVVSKSGFYMVSWAVQGNGNASGTVAACIFVNGVGIQFGPAYSGGSTYGHVFTYYLNAGDKVQAGYYWSGSIGTGYWKGESTGTWTHFEIALANRSLK